jgi:hypothetical protein
VKRWQPIAMTLAFLLAPLSRPGTALAQGNQDMTPVLANVLAKLAILVDGVLGFWVAGGAVTDPLGERLVNSLGGIAMNVVEFVARLVMLF